MFHSGNITYLTRNGDAANLNMDDFTYNYETNRNRLTHVEDVYGNVTGNDLPNQSAGNYSYDAMGNLIADASEEIASIEWDVRGKVRKVTRTATSTKSDLEFFYDALGQRVMKLERKKNVAVGGQIDVTTIYVRDATGNVMAVYTNERVRVAGDPSGPVNTVRNTLTLDEHHIYGASRLGMETYDNLVLADFTTINHPVFSTIIAWPVTPNNELVEQRELKKKRYELTDHLENVLVTVSDRKLAVDANTNGTVDYYLADVISYNDYYPGHALMPGRHGNTAAYRYGGAGGQEKTDEISGEGNHYTAEFWEYSPRIMRRWNQDPKISQMPSWSPYSAFYDNPLRLIDPTGEAPTNYEDENGNSLGSTNDGSKATVTIRNDQVTAFKGHFAKDNESGFANSTMAQESYYRRFGAGMKNKELSQSELTAMSNSGQGNSPSSSSLIYYEPVLPHNKFPEFITKERRELFNSFSSDNKDISIVPEFSEDVSNGVTLAENMLVAASEEVSGYTPHYKDPSYMPPSSAKQYKLFSYNVTKIAQAYTIVDKGAQILNHVHNKNYGSAAEQGTALFGYTVSSALMASPTPATQLVGLGLLGITMAYDYLIGD